MNLQRSDEHLFKQLGTSTMQKNQQFSPDSDQFIDSDEEREKNAELFSAIKHDKQQKVLELLKAGVKVNITDKNNKDNTPLHYAIERNANEIAKNLIVEWKADINTQNNKGNTPLHVSTLKGNKELVQLLVSKKANIDIKNENSITPKDIAKKLNKQDIIDILDQIVILTNSLDKLKIQPPEHTLNLTNAFNKLKIENNQVFYNGEKSASIDQFQETLSTESRNRQLFSNFEPPSYQQKEFIQNQTLVECRFQKRQGTTGSLDGHFYEIDLLILCKLRGDRDTNRFFLATNVDGLGAFDDVVMRYWKNDSDIEKSTIIFLQAKHVENSKKNKITIEKFTNPKEDKFYLKKYFSDYLNSRYLFNDKSEDLVFRDNFHELDIKYIIYTNAVLDEKFDKNRMVDIDNNIISTKSTRGKDKAFKFSLDGTNSDVIEMLENASYQERVKLLAKAVVSCICGKLNYNNMMGNDFIKTYHVFLAKNVIDVEKGIEEEKKKNKYVEGKINDKFLIVDHEDIFITVLKEEVLHEYAKEVIFNKKSTSWLDDFSERDILINKIKCFESSKKLDEDTIERLGGNFIMLDTKNRQLKFIDEKKIMNEKAKVFIRDLKSKISNFTSSEFDFPQELVKRKLKFQTEKEPLKLHVDFGNIGFDFKKPEHLIKRLIELFKKFKLQKVIKIDDSLVGYGKELTRGDIKNIGKLVGNLLVFDEKKRMLKLANEKSLDGDAKEFIIKLKTTAESADLEVDNYRFDIKVKNFPKDTLFVDSEDKTNVEEFFNKLEVFTGQASDLELKKIIKDELKSLYSLTEEEVEDNFLKIRSKGEEHWRNGDYYLQKGGDFFTNIVKFNIKFDVKDPVDLFSGREEELYEVHNMLQHRSKKITVISQMTSISGLGGIGKTELAREYINKYSQDYDNNIIWISAENNGTLSESFRRLALDKLSIGTKDADENEKDIKSIVQDVYIFFKKRKSLFIFDNAERSTDFIKFLPHRSLDLGNNVPCILVTSRDREWGGEIKVLNLNELKLKDAIRFVKKGLKIKDESQDKEIKALVIKLQCFPLAIQQAISYIEDQKVTGAFSIDSYLKEYNKKTKDLLDSEAFNGIDNDYAKTTYTTWKITIEKIATDQEHGKLALDILNTIAYFSPNNIDRKMFLKLAEDNESKLKSSVRLLIKYSMLNGEQEQSILNVHRLVQEVIRIDLKSKEKEILNSALELFHVDGSKVDLFVSRPRNVDHAISVCSYANKHDELVKKFSSLPVLIIKELNAALRYQEASLFGKNALEVLKKLLGENHISVLSMMNEIASVLYNQGKDDESLEIYRKLNEKSNTILKLTNQKCMPIFDTMIGNILNRQNKHDEALEIFTRQHDLIKKGIINSDGIIEHNKALTLSEQRKFEQAMNMFKIALKRKIEIFGPHHEITLNTKNSIAATLERQGKYEDALKESWDVYEKRKEALGPDHPDTLTTYCNIALTLTKLRKHNEALTIANEVDAKREKLCPDHPRTLKGKLTIAMILDAQGKYGEAIQKLKEVYKKRKEILGHEHKDTLNLLDYWCDLAVKLAKRKYDEALKELNSVLEERKNIFPSNDSSVLLVESKIRKLEQNNGADIKIADPELYMAAQEGHLDVVNNMLREGYAVDIHIGENGFTPLQVAAHRGHIEIVDAFLEKGALVDLKDFADWTALHYAAQSGHSHVANALLNKGANVNQINSEGETPLHLASLNGHINTVQTLLKLKNIDVNVKTVYGVTQLHNAMLNGKVEIVTQLLNCGANINATDTNDWTPLHDAAYWNRFDAVTVLLNWGANINASCQNGRNPLQYTSNDWIKRVLQSTQELFDAIRQKKNESNIQNLLESWANINAVFGKDRLTILHFAVYNGDLAIIKALLKKKANVNADDIDGWTPLHYAAQEGCLDVVKLLLDKGADCSVVNSSGKTPLQLVKKYLDQNPRKYRKIVHVLKIKLAMKILFG